MKKFLLSLIVGLSCVAMQAEPVVETLTVDKFAFTGSSSYCPVTYTSGVTGIKYDGKMFKASASDGGGMQFRTSSGGAGIVATGNSKGYQIVSVKVTPSKGSATWEVYGNSVAYEKFEDLFDTNKQGSNLGSNTATATVTPSDKYSFFGFRSKSGTIYIKEIEITYELGGPVDTREECGLAYSAEEFTANIGAANNFPTLTNPYNLAVTYGSENPAVATVDENGTVEPLAEGTTKITATFAGTTPTKQAPYSTPSLSLTPTNPNPTLRSTSMLSILLQHIKFIRMQKTV